MNQIDESVEAASAQPDIAVSPSGRYRFLSFRQGAVVCGTSLRNMYHLLNKGELPWPVTRIGKAWRLIVPVEFAGEGKVQVQDKEETTNGNS